LSYFHIVRICAATSTGICWALRSDAAALTKGHDPISKYCNTQFAITASAMPFHLPKLIPVLFLEAFSGHRSARKEV